MLYLGHFSFDAEEGEQTPVYGYFTCISEADTPEAAVKAFNERIHAMRQSGDLLPGEVEIYLDDLIELSHLPQQAIVTRYQVSQGIHPPYSDCSLPIGEVGTCTAYRWSSDDKPSQDGRHTSSEIQPFIRFAAQ